MIALCPTCHRQLGKLSRDECYRLKKSPRNAEAKLLYGELGTKSAVSSFLVGSNTFIDTPIVFEYFGAPIIQYTIEDHAPLISIYFPREDY